MTRKYSRVSALHSVVAGSISIRVISRYTLLMRHNKVETAVQLFPMLNAMYLPDFLVMVIQFIDNVCLYKLINLVNRCRG